MRNDGSYDRVSGVHNAVTFPYVHNSPRYAWWHRHYLDVFESEARGYDPCFSLCSFNSTDSDYSSVENLVGSLRVQGCIPGLPRCIKRDFNPTFLPWDARKVERLIASDRQTFEASFETPFHRQVHLTIGGQVATFSSAADPIFWLHHCFTDRVLCEWQRRHPEDLVFDVRGELPFFENIGIEEVRDNCLSYRL
jgi:hypothetical protein